jgi:polar amino acid transport system substrate-binding protein
MKTRPIYILLLVFALIVSACGSDETPTPAPTVSADPVWDRVATSGKIIFGTSVDYPPFESYDQYYQPTGFDIALAREIGVRLGLQVQFLDIPFEGLIASIQAGQVDAAIAAMSVTPERQQSVNFSNIYFNDKTSVLSRQGSGIKITSPNQLSTYRVGVQRGTSYEQWIKKNLIEPGLMPLEQLFAYAKPEDAVRDLRESRIEVVVMESLAAEEYVQAGGVEVSGESLNPQLYAIAISKGSPTMQTKLNETLTQIQNDGTLARLAEQYLGVQIETEPLPTPPPSTGTAVPAACDAMAFVADVTIPDGTRLTPSTPFDKVWRIMNTGTCTWDSSYQLAFVDGDRMDGNATSISGSVAPGQTYDVKVQMVAPNTPGHYAGLWQMVNGQGIPFGTRIWVQIEVFDPSVPNPTPVPPSIEYFTGPQSAVGVGEVIVISWKFSTQDVVSAKLNRTNPDGSVTQLYGGADVPPEGTYEDLAVTAGEYTYTLTVTTEFGGSQTATVPVFVAQ